MNDVNRPVPSKVGPYFFSYLKRFKKTLVFMLPAIALGTFFEKLSPYYFSKIIDVISEHLNNKEVLFSELRHYFLLFILVCFAYNIVRYYGMYLARKIIVNIGIMAKKDALDYVLGHSVKFLTDTPSGSIGSKINDLSRDMPDMFLQLLWDFYRPLLLLIITFCMLWLMNPLFAILFLFWMVVSGVILYLMSNRLKPYAVDSAEKRSQTSGRFLDILGNALLVKSFAAIPYENKMLKGVLSAEINADMLKIRKLENSRFVQFIIIALFQITMILLALFLWNCGVITAGSIVFMLFLISDIMHVFQFLMFALLDWNKLIGSIENALKLLSAPQEIQDIENAKDLKILKANINFEHVNFAYNARKKVFNDFTLHIKSGEKIGLVGVSGSGKTTFVSLLQRFYDINAGAILIDGQDISKVKQDSLRRQIAVIPQDTTLFHRSVFDNIAYGNPKAGKTEVINASKRAYADDFILALPNGYDSMVGERGIKLSGGQRQRIAIARAILKDAPILILDEATSALDSESEAFIQKSMRDLMNGKTVIAIAHRLSTLKEMDRIIILDKGQIIEQGTAEELLKKDGTYAHLWKIQTGK
ncbi:MAG: ABC transporter ATP-binding protein [Alphaproteobacteria bacterium]